MTDKSMKQIIESISSISDGASYETAEALRESAKEIYEIARNAYEALPHGIEKHRAKVYWYSRILNALGESYGGNPYSISSMESSAANFETGDFD